MDIVVRLYILMDHFAKIFWRHHKLVHLISSHSSVTPSLQFSKAIAFFHVQWSRLSCFLVRGKNKKKNLIHFLCNSWNRVWINSIYINWDGDSGRYTWMLSIYNWKIRGRVGGEIKQKTSPSVHESLDISYFLINTLILF